MGTGLRFRARCYDASMSVRFGVFPLVLAAAGCVVWPAGSGPGAAPISAADALSMSARGEAVIVDVRPREAYEAGHIPGALHVEALEIGARAAELRRLGRLPILYCG
jgi:hypothetical protein